jgi:hypothetical protein
MNSAILSVVLAIMTVSSQMARGAELDGLLRYGDLEVLAKKAILDETSRVNLELQNKNYKIPGYKEKYFKVLTKDLGKNQIDPSFLFSKCIMDTKSIQAVLSKSLTPDSDDLAPRVTSLASVKANYNSQIWKMTSRMCVLSKERFEARLKEITSSGKPVQLHPEAIDNLSKLVFFPTVYGKPSFKGSMYSDFGYLVAACSIIGAASSIFGVGFAGVVISVAVISGTSMSFKEAVPHAEAELHRLDMKEISSQGLIKLDFDNTEAMLVKRSRGT